MPSGPSVLDEVANAALLVRPDGELGARYEDITKHMDFDHAGANFYTAAREGSARPSPGSTARTSPRCSWCSTSCCPSAEAGLRRQKVDEADIQRYLGIIDARLRSAHRRALAALVVERAEGQGHRRRAATALVAATIKRQQTRRPVAEWERARLDEASSLLQHNYLRVEQYMTTDLFTVHADDPVEIVDILMDWERMRHVPGGRQGPPAGRAGHLEPVAAALPGGRRHHQRRPGVRDHAAARS